MEWKGSEAVLEVVQVWDSNAMDLRWQHQPVLEKSMSMIRSRSDGKVHTYNIYLFELGNLSSPCQCRR
jgi:hypothetical protein